jgi:hypothetical protein
MDDLIIETDGVGSEIYGVFNESDSTYILAFTEGRIEMKQLYHPDHMRIVCIDKSGGLKWTKKTGIDQDEEIFAMTLEKDNLIFIGNGINKLNYMTTSQNIPISIIRYFNLHTGRVTEHFFDQKSYGLAKNNSEFYILTRDNGCKSKQANITLRLVEKDTNDIIKEKSKVNIDQVVCLLNRFNTTPVYFASRKSLEYIKVDYEPKPGKNQVSMQTNINPYDHQSRFEYVTISNISKKKTVKKICSNCGFYDFRIMDQERSVAVRADTAGNKLCFYYPATNKTKELDLGKDCYSYTIYPHENELLLIGIIKGTEISYTFIKDEKIIWTKTSPKINQIPKFNCFFTTSEIIVTYLWQNVGDGKGEPQNELRKLVLKK